MFFSIKCIFPANSDSANKSVYDMEIEEDDSDEDLTDVNNIIARLSHKTALAKKSTSNHFMLSDNVNIVVSTLP